MFFGILKLQLEYCGRNVVTVFKKLFLQSFSSAPAMADLLTCATKTLSFVKFQLFRLFKHVVWRSVYSSNVPVSFTTVFLLACGFVSNCFVLVAFLCPFPSPRPALSEKWAVSRGRRCPSCFWAFPRTFQVFPRRSRRVLILAGPKDDACASTGELGNPARFPHERVFCRPVFVVRRRLIVFSARRHIVTSRLDTEPAEPELLGGVVPPCDSSGVPCTERCAETCDVSFLAVVHHLAPFRPCPRVFWTVSLVHIRNLCLCCCAIRCWVTRKRCATVRQPVSSPRTNPTGVGLSLRKLRLRMVIVEVRFCYRSIQGTGGWRLTFVVDFHVRNAMKMV